MQYAVGLLRGLTIVLFFPALYGQQIDAFGLTRPKGYSAHRTSSTNPDLRSNDDAKRPIPGETIVLADLNGPGVITHIWITSSNAEYGWPRLFRLRMFYDGSSTPSVDAPIGDFFGSGHGLERTVNSQMVRVSSSGRSRNCYWPMPFRKRCRITVTNEGEQRPNSFYYQVDWKAVPDLPADTLYFHALYRQEVPAKSGSLYDVLTIRGRGHYVGTVFSVLQTQPGWFGEGDESFFIDGETTPTLHGTGTEDYFGDAYELHLSEGLYAGTTVAEGAGAGARMTAYRWHLPDPIPFERSLRFGFEHAGFVLNADGSVRATFDERPDYFSSVAFWYQQGIAMGLPEPPYGARRLPHGNALRFSAANLSRLARAQQGTVELRDNLLWFASRTEGAELSVLFDVPREGRYELLLQHARGAASGRYEVSLDGQAWPGMGNFLIDGHAAEPAGPGEQVLAWANLSAGSHRLAFRCAGKAAAAEGLHLGIDGLVVSEVGQVPPEPAAALQLRRMGLENRGAIPELLRGLDDRDPEVRAAAAWALGQWGPRAAAALPNLVRALNDGNAIVRGLAAIALREVGGAAPDLIKGLRDPDANVRMICAEALGRLKAATAVPALIELSRNPAEDLAVLRNVAAALGEIGPAAEEAIPALEGLKANPRLSYPATAAQRKIAAGKR